MGKNVSTPNSLVCDTGCQAGYISVLINHAAEVIATNTEASELFSSNLVSRDVRCYFRHIRFLSPDGTVLEPSMCPPQLAAAGKYVKNWRGMLVLEEPALIMPVSCTISELGGYTLLSIQDISEEIQLLQDNTYLQKEIQSLVAFCTAFTELYSGLLGEAFDEHSFQKILDEAIKFIPGAEAGSILRFNEDAEVYEYVATSGYDLSELSSVTFSRTELLYGLCDDEDYYIVTDTDSDRRDTFDVERWQVLRDHGRAEEIEASLLIPVYSGGSVAAALLLDSFEGGWVFTANAKRRALVLKLAIELTLKQAFFQKELRESAEHLREIFQSSPVPTLIIDSKTHCIIEVNSSFTNLLLYSKDSLVAKKLTDLVCQDSIKNVNDLISTCGQKVELCLETAKGQHVWYLAAGQRLDSVSQAIVITFLDITERRFVEEELRSALELMMTDSSWFAEPFLTHLAAVRSPRKKLDRQSNRANLCDLTKRELDVLSLLAQGHSNRLIAEDLSINLTTVRNYVGRIYSKIDVHSRAQAAIWARQRGLCLQNNFNSHEF